MVNIHWDQLAVLIDLGGKTPVMGSMFECVMRLSIFKPFVKEQACVLLARTMFCEGLTSRTWILNPDDRNSL